MSMLLDNCLCEPCVAQIRWLSEYLQTRSINDWAQIYDADYPTSGAIGEKGISLPVPALRKLAKFWLDEHTEQPNDLTPPDTSASDKPINR